MATESTPTIKQSHSITTVDDLHADMLTSVLRRLDGPTLAAASCATSALLSLSSQPDIWIHLCLYTWPSLRLLPFFPFSSHRSFFSQAYPFPFPSSSYQTRGAHPAYLPTELISAVDLYHRGNPVFSRVVETETRTDWFLGAPFRIDALDRNDLAKEAEPVVSPGDLTLSWIVIDPIGRRAVNLSSRRPVEVNRHWYTGEIQVRFGMVLGEGCAAGVVVTCGEGEGHLREVSLTVEDMDGMCLNGRGSLGILEEAMGWGRRGSGEEEREVRERYEEHVRRKRERKELKLRSEGRMDMCCVVFGFLVVLTFWVMVIR